MSSAKQALLLLKQHQKDINCLLEKYFENEIKTAKKIDNLTTNTIKSIRKFTLAGGKRLRPTLLYYAYLTAGGTQDDVVKWASLSIELTHNFLLIHDDIMDNDDKRHGIDTIHKKYEKIAEKYFPQHNSKHFGQSIAIVVGDMCYTMANKILFQAKFQPKIILQALIKLQNVVYEVIPGQIRDIQLGYKGFATEKEILKVQEAKTAHYTFNAPIELGYILAENKSKNDLDSFKKYSLAMGKAFQIRDDILGIFGNEKTLGKPIGSDIMEGKQTLLVNYVLKNGSAKEKMVIKNLLGKNKINKAELRQFRTIIKNSGALSYSEQKGKLLIQKAKQSLKNINWQNKKAKIFFQGIAEYIIQRKV